VVQSWTQVWQDSGFQVLAVGLQQSLPTLKQYARQYTGMLILDDSALTCWNLYNIANGTPTNYVIDVSDTVRYPEVGWNSGLGKALHDSIQQYLVPLSISEAKSQPLEFASVGANPAVGHGAVRFNLPKAANVSVRVYSTSGALVRTLVNAQMSAGVNTVNWNLRDDASRPVGNGLYLYELKTGSQVAHAKVSVLK
jgi:hypothetical protein